MVGGGGGDPHTVNMIWRGRGEAREAPGGVGTLLEIPGLAARPSGHPGPRRRPRTLAESPRAPHNLQYIISCKVLTMCETPVTPELLSVINTFIHKGVGVRIKSP